MTIRNVTLAVLQGVCIGIGNIIPGVSGGTIALILGIYGRLIEAITRIDIRALKNMICVVTLKKEHRDAFARTWKEIDAFFLLQLGIGVLAAIFSLAFLFTYLLAHWRTATYAFFLGLIFISILAPYRLITKKTWREWSAALLALVLVVGLCYLKDRMEHKAALSLQQKIGENLENPLKDTSKSALKILEGMEGKKAQTDFQRLVLYFFAGMLAICAMILPGISGSFLLLLLGLYFEILVAIKTFNLPVLFVFSLGCLLGLFFFTRLLKYLMDRFFNPTMAFFTGLLIGSLYGIWPFKEEIGAGNYVFYGHNVLPNGSAQEIWTCLGVFVLGCALVVLLDWYGQKMSEEKHGEISR